MVGYGCETGEDGGARAEPMVPVKGEDIHLCLVGAPGGETDVPLKERRNGAASQNIDAADRHYVGPATDLHGTVADHHVRSFRRNEAWQLG